MSRQSLHVEPRLVGLLRLRVQALDDYAMDVAEVVRVRDVKRASEPNCLP